MKLKNLLAFILILAAVPGIGQKKFTITVCIDGESWLHIKNGQLFWEHKAYSEPGTHKSCTTKTTVNKKVWEMWNVPFALEFNTANMQVEAKILKTNIISRLQQAPSAANDWETIWLFSDPVSGPHDYSVTFFFSPKKDTALFAATVSNKPEPEKKLTPKEINIIIDSLSYELNKYYIYEDKAKLMSSAIQLQRKKGVYNKAKDRVELSMMINNDINAVHRDGHFRLRYDPVMAKNLETVMTDSERNEQYSIDLKNAQKNNFSFIKAEILPGNIGYLRWDGFTGMVDEAAPVYKAAFKLMEHTSALIIDMRYNGGGSPDMVLHTQNYFFDKKVGMNHIFTRNDTSMRYTDPAKTEFKLKMPVYILTARRTFSGAEDFTYGMKYGNRATVVGDTTGGGAHPTDMLSVAYGYGFVASIPFGRSYHEVTKTDWEGTGVRPDIPVNPDHALLKAQTMIYKDLITKAGDMREKNELQWSMDIVQNKLGLAKQISSDSVIVTKELLKSLAGEYMPKTIVPSPSINNTMGIVFKSNNIYRRVMNGSAPDARLSQISATRFVYDDDSGRYMDFNIDKDGKVLGVYVTRWDGTNYFEKIK